MSAQKLTAGIVAIAALLFCSEVWADIYKCEGDDGNLIYQQTPCAKEEPVKADAPDEPEVIVTSTPTLEDEDDARSPEFVAQCKKKYRDAIDEIDAEMRQGYSSEQGEAYRQRLRILTEQLRAC
jgi:hypothetical protein